MLKFFINVFCNDTIIGLKEFEDIKKITIYKNRHISLFCKNCMTNNFKFTDPIACHL